MNPLPLAFLVLGSKAPELPTVPPVPVALSAPASSRVQASLALKVHHRDEVFARLVEEAEARGGYLHALGRVALTVRLPTAQVGDYLAAASGLGLVVDRGWTSEDVSASLAELRARLGAKEEVLARYSAVLEEAGPEAVVDVERQIVSLIGQIEGVKGQIRLLENQLAWASVEVSLRLRERAEPDRRASSSFAWINTVNLADLVDGFQSGRVRTGRRVREKLATPEGFAPYLRLRRAVAAASPDGVLFQARAERHEPQADLAFWQEALRLRLVEAGYNVLGERRVELAGKAGFRFELAAPWGDEDWLYHVAVLPGERELLILEAAGEAARLHARRPALIAVMGGEGEEVPTRAGG